MRLFNVFVNDIKEKGLKYTLRVFWEASMRYMAIPFYSFRLEKNKHIYPESLEYSWNSFKAILKPAQKKPEIKQLLELIKKEEPKVFLEIGTGKGGTLFLFTSVLPNKSQIISVDLRGKPYGAGYPSFMRGLIKKYARGEQDLRLVERDSHKKETRDYIKSIINKPVDFLFIDGDHTYEGVKRDFELYSSLVKKKGVISFHDIKAYHSGCGVYKFWDEIKTRYKHLEFADKDNPYGIGVIYN